MRTVCPLGKGLVATDADICRGFLDTRFRLSRRVIAWRNGEVRSRVMFDALFVVGATLTELFLAFRKVVPSGGSLFLSGLVCKPVEANPPFPAIFSKTQSQTDAMTMGGLDV